MSNERTPRRGIALIVSSPSGAGKTSLCRRLIADHEALKLSISMTTRTPRPGEENGREYHFIDDKQFDGLIAQGAFLEWAQVHGARYGSPRDAVISALHAGRDVLFDIDWQGGRSIAAAMPADTVRVFVLPPSMQELRRRLYARAQDKPEVIERRLKRAREEIAHWDEYDYIIVNDDFDRSLAELAHVYHAERDRQVRNPWIANYVEALMAEQD
ncbi:MAG TPA: guanylate kinase [Caulobacteraceae bacterium]|jgi:guanylate kinase|nr:guanylate kinase [Caulobacteraceae bacterium]